MTPLRLTLAAIAASLAFAAHADTIKIGEINSYKAQPAFLLPYKNGWNLALDEINAASMATSSKSSRAMTTAIPAIRFGSRKNSSRASR
jgi:branched-chain amino acid transport system substrate-binding protein